MHWNICEAMLDENDVKRCGWKTLFTFSAINAEYNNRFTGTIPNDTLAIQIVRKICI